MKEVPGLYADFRAQFPEILEKNEELGRMVHEQGPLDEKTRSLVKIVCCLTIRIFKLEISFAYFRSHKTIRRI